MASSFARSKATFLFMDPAACNMVCEEVTVNSQQDVMMISAFAATSTLGSIAQQIHYATAWISIKQGEFDQAVRSLSHPGLAWALGGSAAKANMVLYYIQFYCYNVVALNMFFCLIIYWHLGNTVGLAWELEQAIGTYVKNIFNPLSSGHILATILGGSILIVLIVYKYLKTRRLFADSDPRGIWWATQESEDRHSVDTGRKMLVTRFTIGFIVLVCFEATVVTFTLVQNYNVTSANAAGEPDHSTTGAIVDIVLFIPGATVSLAVFLVFGTTRSWRQYRDLIFCGCGSRTGTLPKSEQRSEIGIQGAQDLEFQRLPSITHRPSVEEAARKWELERRVRMFSGGHNAVVAPGLAPVVTHITDPSSRISRGSTTKTQRLHRPFPSITSISATSRVVELGLGLDIDDLVIQYERPIDETTQEPHTRHSSTETKSLSLAASPPRRHTAFLDDASI
ncbi:uncharacterized protein BP5553_04921 [Venustampulla echinocandica]|uniref:Uncharacterized protein n=1 Tax=Venustampulla echinocandica TaxID=2656787 RepID=A0A370TPP7_9HELO|nr:uncharacterized protein BP5553_04921 [Venustampulla echinocandica]RDL37488.1 hypothetical protein BP5553_04921 [Venustampulla echinocandica]